MNQIPRESARRHHLKFKNSFIYIYIYIYIYDFAIMPDRMKLIYIESAEKTYLIASAFPLLQFSRRVWLRNLSVALKYFPAASIN